MQKEKKNEREWTQSVGIVVANIVSNFPDISLSLEMMDDVARYIPTPSRIILAFSVHLTLAYILIADDSISVMLATLTGKIVRSVNKSLFKGITVAQNFYESIISWTILQIPLIPSIVSFVR